MPRITLHYLLGDEGGSALLRNPLIALLQALASQGSISAAARALGLSYRHVWGELRRWEETLGAGLVVWGKGQSAVLTESGIRLLGAEQLAQARHAPQIDALRAELERSYALALDPRAAVTTLYASHDDALVALRECALAAGPGANGTGDTPGPLHLDIRYCASLDAVRALNEGRCEIAVFHSPQAPASGARSERSYQPLLHPARHRIIGFAQRTQGLIVTRGNPLGLQSLQDLQRRQARFVGRSQGSGTRLLLEDLLAQAGLQADQWGGAGGIEPTHDAVAMAVALGQADAGLGTEAAARRCGLDFLPLARETCHLACTKTVLELPSTKMLLTLLRSAPWKARLASLPGYQDSQGGVVRSLRAALPGWSFTPRRSENPRKGGPTAAAGSS